MQRNDLEDWEREISGVSDRAAAILAAAYLERRLTEAIRAHLQEDKSAFEQMFGVGKPLGALSLKANIGYLLKLYTKRFRDNLLVIAKVRNKFAHHDQFVDFDRRIIKEIVEKIDLHFHIFSGMPPDSPLGKIHSPPFSKGECRYHYMSAVNLMTGHLGAMADDPAHPKVL
jgi:hypothetical protein